LRSLVAFIPSSEDSGVLDESEEPPRIAVRIVLGTVVLHYHCILDEMVFYLRVGEKRVHYQRWREVCAGVCSRLA